MHPGYLRLSEYIFLQKLMNDVTFSFCHLYFVYRFLLSFHNKRPYDFYFIIEKPSKCHFTEKVSHSRKIFSKSCTITTKQFPLLRYKMAIIFIINRKIGCIPHAYRFSYFFGICYFPLLFTLFASHICSLSLHSPS